VAAGVRRLAAPHARFRLSEPELSVTGSASQLAGWAEHLREELARFVARLAQATSRPSEHVEADLAAGRWLGAEEALVYGLIDEIWSSPAVPERPGGPASRPSRPFGFGPRPGTEAGPA
jgi:ATP-dependent Clp protease protease subunit